MTVPRRRKATTTAARRGGGRPKIDWAQARAFYLELGPTRSFVMVGERFGVSDTAVRKHAGTEGWHGDAVRFDEESSADLDRATARSREQRIEAYRLLVDSVLDSVKARAHEAKVSDLPSLLKVLELLEGEPTERVSFDELQAALRLAMTVAIQAAERVAQSHLNGDARVFVEEYRLVFMGDFERALGA